MVLTLAFSTRIVIILSEVDYLPELFNEANMSTNPWRIIKDAVRSPLSYSLLDVGPQQAPPQAQQQGPPAGQTVSGPFFKLIFISVGILTLVIGGAEIWLASMWLEPTDNQQTAFAAMDFGWKTGFGAWIGLAGGKAIT
jgi:hypothetical protein